MVLEISAQAETHNLSSSTLELKENDPILKYNGEQNASECFENSSFSTLEPYFGPCMYVCMYVFREVVSHGNKFLRQQMRT